jgi:hypothetical protein
MRLLNSLLCVSAATTLVSAQLVPVSRGERVSRDDIEEFFNDVYDELRDLCEQDPTMEGCKTLEDRGAERRIVNQLEYNYLENMQEVLGLHQLGTAYSYQYGIRSMGIKAGRYFSMIGTHSDGFKARVAFNLDLPSPSTVSIWDMSAWTAKAQDEFLQAKAFFQNEEITPEVVFFTLPKPESFPSSEAERAKQLNGSFLAILAEHLNLSQLYNDGRVRVKYHDINDHMAGALLRDDGTVQVNGIEVWPEPKE